MDIALSIIAFATAISSTNTTGTRPSTQKNNFFTGVSSRGHCPVKYTLKKPVKLKVNEKSWIKKTLWDKYTNHMENENLVFSEENPDASCMCEYFKRSMEDATKLCIPNQDLQIIVNRSGARTFLLGIFNKCWNEEVWNENYISKIEINLCGLSDRSRNAIDRYLDQCKPEVVHLSETEKKYSENTFTNYKTFNKISTHSTGNNFNQEWLIIR